MAADRPLVTLFGTPKAFEGHFAVIQYNAIKSWTLLGPRCEVILMGDDPGAAETAAELGIQHVRSVSTNESGVPLLDGLLRCARQRGSGEVLCYANTDIILMPGLLEAIEEVKRPAGSFMMTGQRTSVDIDRRIDFSGDWERYVRASIEANGALDPPTNLDYFVFSTGILTEIPSFAIGRTAWDNFLLYAARRDGARLIDATSRVTAVHQRHDYSSTTEDVWHGAGARRNRELVGGSHHLFTLVDATHELGPEGLRPARQPAHLLRRSLTWPMLSLGWSLPLRVANQIKYRTRWRRSARNVR